MRTPRRFKAEQEAEVEIYVVAGAAAVIVTALIYLLYLWIEKP